MNFEEYKEKGTREMSYKYDGDLEFLKFCDNDDLGVLVEYLTKSKSGEIRLTESLTTTEKYKKNYPNHKEYWKEIADEIQCCGGNTFSNIFRGFTGVQYKEVLIDVCKKMKVQFNENSTVGTIENELMCKIVKDTIEKLTQEELKDLVEELKINPVNLTKQGVTVAIQFLIRQGGFASYQILVIVANIVARQLLGHGLKFATNAALTRTMAVLTGPIGWIITGVWTMIDIAGPAYRITIPCCIQIGYMRNKFILNNPEIINRQQSDKIGFDNLIRSVASNFQ